MLRALLPPATTAVTVNRSDGPTDAAVHDRILNALNRGPSIVNYYGHGAVDIWTGADLLKSADATSLRNAGGLSLFMMMTCLNGYFIEPRTQSLAEALLRAPHGGAFAVWASSGLTVPADQIRANEELVRQLAATQSPRLGDAMVRTKSVITRPGRPADLDPLRRSAHTSALDARLKIVYAPRRTDGGHERSVRCGEVDIQKRDGTASSYASFPTSS